MNEPFDVVAELRVLKSRVEDWMTTTKDYRILLCEKIEKLMGKVDALPCDRRESRYLEHGIQIKWLWGALTFFITMQGLFITTLITHLGK